MGKKKKKQVDPLMSSNKLSNKKKLIRDGVFLAEINEFFRRQLVDCGYIGLRADFHPKTQHSTRIIIKATKRNLVLGERESRKKDLIKSIQQRFNLLPGSISLSVYNAFSSLSAEEKADLVCKHVIDSQKNHASDSNKKPINFKKRVCTIIENVMKNGARGCETAISGKTRALRAKVVKFRKGCIISTGQPAIEFVDEAIRHVKLRKGILGIRVRIVKDSLVREGENTLKYMPDYVKINYD